MDYAARDRAALKLRPNKEWEEQEKRRQVFKHAKATLAPLAAKGDVDDDLFPTVVSTVCYEFFATNTRFGEAERRKLAADVLRYAQTRIEERQVKEAYRKMNLELLEKIKRIDAERKTANAKVISLQSQEETMKAEIFNLRGHKQDILLSSFKRLTRAGLIKQYWSRWKSFRGIVEAQLHVRARERRALEMTHTNKELEDEVSTLKAFVKQLQDRVQQAEGRDVIAMLLKQSGQQLVHRYFTNWRRYSLEAIKEKQFYEAREQILNCPNCELRETDNQRVRARLHEAYRAYRETIAKLEDAVSEAARLNLVVEEKTAFTALQELMATEANKAAAEMSKKVLNCDSQLWAASVKQHSLEAEIERLQFEVMSLSDFNADKKHSGATMGGGGGGGQGAEPSTSRTLGNFFAAESEIGAAKLRGRLAARTQGLSKAAATAENNHASVVMTAAKLRDAVGGDVRPGGRAPSPYRGAVRMQTEAALAPLIRSMPQPGGFAPGQRDSRYHDPAHPRPPSEERPESLLYRQPLSDSDASSDSDDTDRAGSGSDGDAAPPPPPPPEDEKCDRCGFRKRLTPFCPKDGTRHRFEGFATDNDPLRQLQPDQSEAAYTLAHRRTLRDRELNALPPGLPPPEYRQAADFGERSASAAQVAHSSTAMTQSLRQSLNLDPRQYDPRRAAPLTHTVSGPLEGDTSDFRAIAEHVRNTRMAIERRTQTMRDRNEPVPLPPGHIPLGEFKRGLGTQAMELQSGIGMRTAVPSSVHRTERPSYKPVFDYNDDMSDAFGIGTGSAAAFGVYRGSEATTLRSNQAAVPAQRFTAEQRATPSMLPAAARRQL
jgi:hypothetical protein